MKEIYDSYMENAFGERMQAEFKFKQFEYNYKKYFPKNKDVEILDIGVGRGEMLTCFKKWGYKNYFGIDISPSTIDFCQSIGLNCQCVHDSNDYLRKNQNRYHLITLTDVLEHIPREFVIQFLKDIKNALVDDGIVIIQIPNLQSPDGFLHMYNDITHACGYIEHSLAQVLIAAGFQRFTFHGYEEFTSCNIKTSIKKSLRNIYWKFIRFNRFINGNINPTILNPVFSAIVKKQ